MALLEDDQPQQSRPGHRSQLRQQQPHQLREINGTPQHRALEPITLQVSDGPAARRARDANIYPLGQLVPLKCETKTGCASHLQCTVTKPDGTNGYLAVSADHTARFMPTQPGRHTYAFAARDAGNQLAAVASAIFIVEAA